ncbi:MAG: ABC transporter ATP-binding protein, partial [Alphaproteobacteria bacterium]
MSPWAVFRPIIALFLAERRAMLFAGFVLAAATVLAGIALLGVSGWFITATAIAGLASATALIFDVFAPAAAIRFVSLLRTAARYGERLTTHEAMFAILAGLRERLFRRAARPQALHRLAAQPSRRLFRLTADIDALDSLYLRVLVPAAVALCSALAMAFLFGLIQPLLGLALGAFLLASGYGIPLLAARASRNAARRRGHALEVLRAQTIDLVAGQTELAMAGQLCAHRHKVMRADTRLGDAEDRLNRIEAAVIAGFGITSALLLGGVLMAVALLAQAGMIGAPVAGLCLLAALAALEPFAGLRRGAVELGRT